MLRHVQMVPSPFNPLSFFKIVLILNCPTYPHAHTEIVPWYRESSISLIWLIIPQLAMQQDLNFTKPLIKPFFHIPIHAVQPGL